MATIVFYEKPGCSNNTRQKVWLAAFGHTVLAKSILTEKWTAPRLRSFFGELPVTQWFNPAAPRVKSGEVNPAALDEQSALELMLAEPLLIRRPLMEVEGELRAGFDADAVREWVGLNDAKPNGSDRPPLLNPLPQAGEEANESLRDFHFNGEIEACPKGHHAQPCPAPEAPSPQSSSASGGGSEREQPCSTLETRHA